MNHHDPRAQLANPAHVADLPMVTRTSAGTVILEASGPHAETLAFILAHYDAALAAVPELDPVPGYEPDVWHHTLLSLLTERAHLRFPIAETVDVDISRVPSLQHDDAVRSDRAVVVALPERAR